MRKRLKRKKRSCCLCKPEKMGKTGKFQGQMKHLQSLKEFEQAKNKLEKNY